MYVSLYVGHNCLGHNKRWRVRNSHLTSEQVLEVLRSVPAEVAARLRAPNVVQAVVLLPAAGGVPDPAALERALDLLFGLEGPAQDVLHGPREFVALGAVHIRDGVPALPVVDCELLAVVFKVESAEVHRAAAEATAKCTDAPLHKAAWNGIVS